MTILTKRVLLGMLTPSSNTILEPVTSAIVSELPHVSAHFGRFRVTEISLRQQALEQVTSQAEAGEVEASGRIKQ
jgi:maleate isomerase